MKGRNTYMAFSKYLDSKRVSCKALVTELK